MCQRFFCVCVHVFISSELNKVAFVSIRFVSLGSVLPSHFDTIENVGSIGFVVSMASIKVLYSSISISRLSQKENAAIIFSLLFLAQKRFRKPLIMDDKNY